MFRVLLATYLVLFACVLPALHTCEPIVGQAAGGATALEYSAHHEHHDHPAHSPDDLCVVCRLSGDSGGVLSPPPSALAVARPVSARIAPEQPILLPSLDLEEILPRAPPA